MNERGFSMDGVVFTEGDLFMEEMGNSQSMDIIYYPTINEYNGNRSLQLVVKDWKFHWGDTSGTCVPGVFLQEEIWVCIFFAKIVKCMQMNTWNLHDYGV